jgi:hypothetical protein
MLKSTYVVTSVCAIHTFTQVPDDDPRRRSKHVGLAYRECNIEYPKIISMHFVGFRIVCFDYTSRNNKATTALPGYGDQTDTKD